MDSSGNAETSSRNAGGECGVTRHTFGMASFAGFIDDQVALFGPNMMDNVVSQPSVASEHCDGCCSKLTEWPV